MQQLRQKKYEPRWMFHEKKGKVLVKSAAHEAALGNDWADTPAKFGVVTHPPTDEQLYGKGPELFEGEEYDDEAEAVPTPPPAPKPRSRSSKQKE